MVAIQIPIGGTFPIQDPFAAKAAFEAWERTVVYNFDQPGKFPYSKRLAKENDWPYGYACEVIEELRRTLFLASLDDTVVAPPDVERAWRLYLIYTDCYFKGLCNALGKTIEHECDDGTHSPTTMSRRYQRTVELYRRVFGDPPAEIWYEPEWFGLGGHRRILHKVSQIIRPDTPRLIKERVENIPPQFRELRAKIKSYTIDRPGSNYPNSVRLADESFDGDYNHALEAEEEYKNFLFLLAITGHWVTPSLDVDEVWHLDLGNTPNYWGKLMGGIIGKRLGHHPGNGSSEDATKFAAIYQRTLHDYAQYFGEPPESIWGKTDPSIDWQKTLAGTGF